MTTAADHTQTLIGGRTGYAVPLVVAVTGHRDLVPDELPEIRRHVGKFLEDLTTRYPERGVTVVSSLAEGADQLVAEVALDLGLPIVTPLPMRKEIYLEDFETSDAKARFTSLLAQASEVFELPLSRNVESEDLLDDPAVRAFQYAQLGVFLCAHCHILLALWDGKHSDDLGGTAQVVEFHHHDDMPGYTSRRGTGRLVLTDDESDLVYHIVCSRDRPNGEPREGLDALTYSWFSSDPDRPRTRLMPERHAQVLARTAEFSRDAVRFSDEIMDNAWSLIDEEQAGVLPAGVRDIDHLYRAADWLAIHFQEKVMRVLRITHATAFLMGLMYIIYSDLVPNRILIFGFVAMFVVATVVHKYGRTKDWHRKYLDYRALAEGLRVQFYWAAAGVTRGMRSKFAHDNFLQTQDSDLGWIRNVMRIAGMECNAAPNVDRKGLEFAISEWVGSERRGQLGYYTRKAREKISRIKPVERFAFAVVVISVLAFTLFMFAPDELAERVRDPVVVMMGVLLLVAGVRQSYTFSVADKELVKQYQFMYRTFTKARRRIDHARSDAEKRQILKLLGMAALDEHSEWIVLQRERPLDESELWRMSG